MDSTHTTSLATGEQNSSMQPSANLGVIIAAEIRRHIVDLRFSICGLLVVLLFTGGAYLMVRDFKMWRSTTDALRGVYAQDYWASGVRQAWLFAHAGYRRQVRPVQAAQMFVAGSETGAEPTLMTEFKRLPSYEEELFTNPLERMDHPPDFPFLCGVVLSLLVFLLSYNAIAGEHRDGTLRVLLASPVSRGVVIAGKWLGGLLSMYVPFAIAVTVVALMVSLDTDLHPGPVAVARLAMAVALGALYIAVVYSLSLMVSTVTRSPHTAAIALVIAWSCMVIAIPALGPALGEIGVGGVDEDQAEARACRAGFTELSHGLNRLTARSGDYAKFNAEQRDVFDMAQARLLVSAEATLLTIGAERQRRHDLVNETARWVNRLSPFGCFQNACLAVANTGADHERRLGAYNLQYLRDWNAYYSRNTTSEYHPIDISAGPAYKYVPAGLGASVRNALFDTGLLCLFGVLFFIVCYRAFAGMDV
jgi:ABC-type transport system involved in multi-copper enzyme maturation permease subunit